MRTAGSLCGWLFAALLGGCGGGGDVAPVCPAEDCPAGQICLDGRCVSDDGGGEADGGDGDDGGPRSCTNPADCDDGDFCSGREECVDGRCEPGTPPSCDDGIECTRDGCNRDRDRCVYSPDHALCPAGQLCTVAGCRAGTACTTAADCDDWVFCNGTERCDAEFGCQTGEAPACDDGIGCTVDGCDRTADRCVSAPNDAVCDDGDPCTVDRCSTTEGGCVAGPTDADGDTFIAATCGGDDCDDRNPGIRPGAPEICDGVDNDCSFLVDEGFSCARGTTVACVTRCGSTGAGACTAACERPDALACVPPVEACNAVDDDCDDLTDEDFECVSGDVETVLCGYCGTDGRACGPACAWQPWSGCAGEGSCSPGATESCVTVCGSSGSGSCTDACAPPGPESCTPPVEVCNGADDDCDTVVDNGFACLAGTIDTAGCGNCGLLSRTCGAACDWDPWGACVGEGPCAPGTSVSCTTTCGSTGTGSCTVACAIPVGGACTPPVEVCNGTDDDCDGLTDEEIGGFLSNLPADRGTSPTAEIRPATSVSVDSGTGEIPGIRAAGSGLVDGIGFQTVSQPGGPTLGLLVVRGLTIPAGVTLSVTGSNPLAILSLGPCQVDGVIDATGASGTVGAWETSARAGGAGRAGGESGGQGSGDGTNSMTAGAGGGAGGAPVPAFHYGNGGGGAGYGGGGGGGATDSCGTAGTTTTAGTGGPGPYRDRGGDGGGPYGAPSLIPLLGGSGGGGGSIDTDNGPPDGAAGGGGAGGGAVQLSCAGGIVIAAGGAIRVWGGNGGNSYSGGGGAGSGGAVLLEACGVTVAGAVEAWGGRGGRGYTHIGAPDGSGERGGIDRPSGGGAGCSLSGGGGGAEGRVRVNVSTPGAYVVSGSVRPAASVGP